MCGGCLQNKSWNEITSDDKNEIKKILNDFCSNKFDKHFFPKDLL